MVKLASLIRVGHALLVPVVHAVSLNLDDAASIKAATSVIAAEMVSHYPGEKPGGIPGLLGDPYYWWEAGAMFGSLIDYWYYTGDSTYNPIVQRAMSHQIGLNTAFMPPNQTKSLGNDDQAFWGFAAMSAAENKFPNPPDDQPQWLTLAQAVLNTQIARWDDTPSCPGGLRWQIFPFNNGYDYKNTISNGCFFALAARLARYTKNNTYVEQAERMWDWTIKMKLTDSDGRFFDGTSVNVNCTEVNHFQWTYNAGVYLMGASFLYNHTGGSQVWKDRIDVILKGLDVFFPSPDGGVMQEVACEKVHTCNVDQRSFKAYLSRWMVVSSQMAPFIAPKVRSWLRVSAIGAAKTCNGGPAQTTCGQKWFADAWDGNIGVGEQMSALSVIGANLIDTVAPPVTQEFGISRGDPSAGTQSSDDVLIKPKPSTTGDRAGAGILTALVLLGVGATTWSLV